MLSSRLFILKTEKYYTNEVQYMHYRSTIHNIIYIKRYFVFIPAIYNTRETDIICIKRQVAIHCRLNIKPFLFLY
jgi:hypothetical protein